MPFNGSGTYNLPSSPGYPAVSGTTITASAENAINVDVATALSAVLVRDGQAAMTGNLPMGGNKVTGMGSGTAATDGATLGQVQNNAAHTLGSVAGTDTLTATASPTLSAYSPGQLFYLTAAGDNTGAVTLNIDGKGAKAVTKNGTTALVAEDIVSGQALSVVYDGTQFQLVSPTAINLSSLQPLDAQLTTLAGTTAQQAADLAAVSTFIGTLLDNADAATALATLGAMADVAPGTSGNVLTSNGSAWVSAAGGKIKQIVTASTATYAGTTQAIPVDDTIPVVTEGEQALTAAITPTDASSTIIAIASMPFMTPNTGQWVVGALFQDSTCKQVSSNQPGGYGYGTIPLNAAVAAGGTSAQTWQIRYGITGSGSVYLNGNSTNRVFGGAASVQLMLIEVGA